MVVRRAELVLTLVVSHYFKGAVRDDLVRIHIHGSSGSSLHHVHRELVMQLAVDDLTACSDDGIGDFRVKGTEFLVGLGGSQLDASHRYDIFRIIAHPGGGNLVIVEGPLGLHTIIRIGWNLEFAEQVGFNPEFLFAHNYQ